MDQFVSSILESNVGIVDSKVEMFCSDFGDTLSSTHWTDASLMASQQQDGNIFFFS